MQLLRSREVSGVCVRMGDSRTPGEGRQFSVEPLLEHEIVIDFLRVMSSPLASRHEMR